jgi:transcriptional regulator with XRE-family HTH domain
MRGFGAELRRRRLAVDMSLSQLAARTHYSKGHLSKVEHGSKPPSTDLARMCDAALEAGGELVALFSTARPGTARPGTAPPGTARAAAAPAAPQPAGAADPAVLADPPQPALRLAADLDATAAQFQAIFARCRELGHQVSPVVVLDMLVQHTRTLCALSGAATDPVRRRRLVLLAARFAEYTGWMAQEAGDERAAVDWTGSAVRLAGAVGDADMVQFALVRGADLALYRDDAAGTIDLARRAQADTRVTPRVRGLAAQREAQGHALAGDYGACMRALDRADALLAAAGTREDGAPVVGSTTLAEQGAAIAGWALHDLGRTAEAARILDAEVPRIPATAARLRTRYGVRRALAHAGAGDVQTACALAADLLPAVLQADSATIRLDLARLNRSLRRWHADPLVRELYPALAEALHTAGG